MQKVNATSAELSAARKLFASAPPVALNVGGEPFPRNFIGGNGVYTHNCGLVMTAELKYFDDSPAVEWTPVLAAPRNSASLRITDFASLSVTLDCGDEPVLAYSRGTSASIEDFAYTEVKVTDTVTLDSVGSRSVLPFFNLHTYENRGVIIALGWTGAWRLTVQKNKNTVSVTAYNVPDSDFYLKPGEHVRGARMLALCWEGCTERAHNMLRRHLVEYNIPKDKAGEPFPPLCCNSWGGMSTAHHLDYIKYLRAHDLRFDCYWIDAGWYGPDREADEFQTIGVEDWSFFQGDYRVNRVRHPDTLKPVSDAAHEAGMKLLLWYDIYNSVEGLGWAKEHPEYGKVTLRFTSNIFGDKDVYFINVNNPEAKKYIIDTLNASFDENGVDYYREDPPPVYGGEDEPDRNGYCAFKAVENLYDIWDGLLEKHPGMLIDNCGGGGSRIDLETVSRSYVLWRTDYNCSPDADPIGAQVGNFGLGRWVPLANGAAPSYPGSDYAFRSGLYGGMSFGLFHPVGHKETGKIYPDADYPVDWHRRMIEQYQLTKPYLSGDFHPLTECGTGSDEFVAYSFDREDLGGGAVMAFRRQNCERDTVTLSVPVAAGTYKVTDFDSGEETTLTSDGKLRLTVKITEKPGSASIYYMKV